MQPGTFFKIDEDRPLQGVKRRRDDEPPPDKAPPEVMEEEPVVLAAARLASVEILDGDDQTALAADSVQFVNLPRDAASVGAVTDWIAAAAARLRNAGLL